MLEHVESDFQAKSRDKERGIADAKKDFVERLREKQPREADDSWKNFEEVERLLVSVHVELRRALKDPLTIEALQRYPWLSDDARKLLTVIDRRTGGLKGTKLHETYLATSQIFLEKAQSHGNYIDNGNTLAKLREEFRKRGSGIQGKLSLFGRDRYVESDVDGISELAKIIASHITTPAALGFRNSIRDYSREKKMGEPGKMLRIFPQLRDIVNPLDNLSWEQESVLNHFDNRLRRERGSGIEDLIDKHLSKRSIRRREGIKLSEPEAQIVSFYLQQEACRLLAKILSIENSGDSKDSFNSLSGGYGLMVFSDLDLKIQIGDIFPKGSFTVSKDSPGGDRFLAILDKGKNRSILKGVVLSFLNDIFNNQLNELAETSKSSRLDAYQTLQGFDKTAIRFTFWDGALKFSSQSVVQSEQGQGDSWPNDSWWRDEGDSGSKGDGW